MSVSVAWCYSRFYDVNQEGTYTTEGQAAKFTAVAIIWTLSGYFSAEKYAKSLITTDTVPLSEVSRGCPLGWS